MATPHGTGTPTSTRPDTSQASMTISSFAVRRYVFRGPILVLLKNKKSTRTQSRCTYSRARNNVSFQYSPRSVACVSTCPTDTARQTARATPVYARNTASYLHFVQTKLKLASSKIDSCRRELDSTISLLRDTIDAYTFNLEDRALMMRYNNVSADYEKNFGLLKAQKNAYTEDLKRRIDLLHAKRISYHGDIIRQFELVKSKSAPFDERLGGQIRQLEAKIESYTVELAEKVTNLGDLFSSFTITFGENFEALNL